MITALSMSIPLPGAFEATTAARHFVLPGMDFALPRVNDLAFDANGKVLVGVFHTQVVFRQTQGLNFEPIGNAPAIDINGVTNNATALAASPNDPNRSSGCAVFRPRGFSGSTNGGQSWTSSARRSRPPAATMREWRLRSTRVFTPSLCSFAAVRQTRTLSIR